MWEKVKLGELATFINGYAFKPSDWSSEGHEIIRIQNLTKSSSETNYYKGQLDNKYKITKGDILISWSATLGVYTWNKSDGWLNQHIFKVVFNKKEINKSFFIYLIQYVLDDLKSQVHGATMKHITKGNFDNTLVPLPPLPIQEKIATILDMADELRRKDKDLQTKYDELAQAIFIDMFGDPVRNEKGWEVIKIADLSNVSSGSTPSRSNDSFYVGNIPWVKTGEVRGTTILETDEKISEEALKSSSCRIYPKGSIIIAMYGQGKTRGQIGILGIDAATNQACAVISPSKKMNYAYLFELLKQNYEDLRSLGRGGNQPNLNAGLIKNYEIINPPLHLQEAFAKKIELINQLKAQTNAQKSEELFQSLLQKAFKGELVS
ncbi:restriction endonuclease subunit S [Sphingobacterium siyangense]|uniref:Type I restriction enzyme S subunit n=1 Tax=Sphingobacterium siyangense TaxID=459529 RepID=A0A562MS36_9SPHI|nr:restriction endonuclease subunit S [Sphingobacterium siyangense]TWI22679.1 type I restriction enzyme S subunit [Sphingobacterium siyangense]